MYLRREHLSRTARAPAKLNLFLEILGRRDDGFHELETLIVPIGLSDFLKFEPTSAGSGRVGKITLIVRPCFPVGATAVDQAVPAGAENLVVRALETLRTKS